MIRRILRFPWQSASGFWGRSFTPKKISKEQVMAITPIDGRYKGQIENMTKYFSEFALIKYRVQVELSWFKYLLTVPNLALNNKQLEKKDFDLIENILKEFKYEDAHRVKEIEAVTNHDVKAVEYFIKEKFKGNPTLKSLGEYIHFSCTSEDVTNLAYGLIFQDGLENSYLPKLDELLQKILTMSKQMAGYAIMSRTHGQPATPTTMGKEFANYAYRLNLIRKFLKEYKPQGKFNGAVGNYNAHVLACPDVNWIQVSEKFVESIGLKWNPYSTQIEQHDSIAKLFLNIRSLNTILVGFCRDLWMYISYGIFKLKVLKGEVGSSTMPHKVNPIFFENAEGNLGISNALLGYFAEKLPVSRMQRDLSDSTVLRNIGSALAYSMISYSSILTGLNRVEFNAALATKELESHYELLAEPVQTVMRRYKKEAPYELLKEFTRGQQVTREAYIAFVEKLDLPADELSKLKALRPTTYLGLAKELAENVTKYF